MRSAGWEHALATLGGDVRYAGRRLWRDRSFAAIGAVTLALGIGASTAIFSAVNPILLAPLPYPDPGRIAAVSDVGASGAPIFVTFRTYLELAQRSRAFDSAAVFKPWQPTIIGRGEPERLEGQRVSAGYFRVLGIAPSRGRSFEPADDRVAGPKVVILSDALWRRRFAADPAIVGQDIDLDTGRYLVIGILPASFDNVVQPAASLWAPLQYHDTMVSPDSREWGHHLRMIARLRAGASLDGARRELTAIARSPLAAFPRVPWASLGNGVLVRPLRDEIAGPVRPLLVSVAGAVLLLLGIVCANVVNLLLARGAGRRGEFALRAALGASRGRLVRQLLVETVLLAGAGGLLGIGLAGAGVRALVALSPPGLPRADAIGLDRPVLLFSLGLTLLVGVAVGLVPAFQSSRDGLRSGIDRASRRSAPGRETTRRLLVIAEVALALTLLVGAGLLLRTLDRLFALPAGFDASHLLTMQVQEAGPRFTDDAARYVFFEQTLDRVLQVPGVESAGWTSQLPLSGDLDGYGAHFERQGASRGDDEGALRYAVTPGYFDAMRIPLKDGRLLDAHDTTGAPRAALLNESFARRLFGTGRDALGQRLRLGPNEGEWYTVVGIVGDVKQTSLDSTNNDAVYVTPRQWHWADPVLSLVVRARGDAAALTPEVRSAIWSIDKDQPILRVTTMDRLVARSEAGRRFALRLFEIFAIVALALATIGIYGVLAGSVAERTREIGIRAALGASRAGILGLVVRQGLVLTAAGIAIGLGGAALASGALSTLLFDVSRLDPATYAGVVTLLAAVSLIACLVPAWRAARVDPAVTLRAE